MNRLYFLCLSSLCFSSLFADSNAISDLSVSNAVEKGWTIDGTFFYWNAKIDGLQFAEEVRLKGLIPNQVPIEIDAILQCKNLPFNRWDPGFQIGLGYLFSERDQWHTRLSWTRFRTESHASISTPETDATHYLFPLWISFLVGPQATHVTADWNLDYDVVDWELSRSFFVGDWLSLEPKFGVRGVRIAQDYDVHYNAFYNAGTIFTNNSAFKADQSFKGVGLKIGSDLEFYMCKQLSLIGNFAASLLWGHYSMQEKANGLIILSSTTSLPETIKFKASPDVLRTNLEGFLGVKWERFFHRDRYRFSCALFYTFSYWFKQNTLTNQIANFAPNLQNPAITETVKSGDLQLQGGNIRLGLEF